MFLLCALCYIFSFQILSSSSHYTTSQINELFDSTMAPLLDRHILSFEERFIIPEIRQTIKTGDCKWFCPDIQFHGFGGFVEGIKSIQRVGDVNINKENLRVRTDVRYHFNRPKVELSYEASGPIGMSVDGVVSGSVDRAYLSLGILFDFTDKECSSRLAHIDIELVNIDFHLTGFAPFNGIVSSIVEDKIKEKLNSVAWDATDKIIRTANCNMIRELSNENEL